MNAPLPAGQLGRQPDRQPDLGPDFERLYRDNHAFVWRCARRMCVDEAELDDVIQDVFVLAYRRLDRLDPEVAPSTWLFGILRNVVRNRGRSRSRHRRRVDAFATHVGERERHRRRVETELGERVLAGRLLTGFLRELDEAQRAVFVLAELEGYTGPEIARALAINPNTAHSRLRLARRAFSRHFGLEPNRGAVDAATRELREQSSGPPAESRARCWGLVLAGVARPAWWAGGAGGLLSVVGAKASLVVAGVALTAGLWVGGGSVPAPVDAPVRASQPPPAVPRSREPVVAATLDTVAPDESVEPDEPVVIRAAHGSKRRATPSNTPEQLRLARAALINADPAQALQHLDTIPTDDTQLLAPRAATRVAALCKLGRVDQAREAVAELRAREPGAAVLPRIESACW